jgi:ATP-binding cassette, subfamily B, bacterial
MKRGVPVAAVAATNSEFSVANAYAYDRRGPIRWIVSHALRYKRLLFTFVFGSIGFTVTSALVPTLTGRAFTEVTRAHPDVSALLGIVGLMLLVVLAQAVLDPLGVLSSEFVAQRMERDAREELYLNLLGKSQTFHNRQRIGDIMARSTNDVRQLNGMMNPGVSIILGSLLNIVVPLVFIAVLDWQLLLAPVLFTIAFAISIRRYNARLGPVVGAQREQFGVMNAGLAETITGIEVVKSTAQEDQERRKFARHARSYRDYFVRQGQVQARYLPRLFLSIAFVIAFLHGLFLVTQGALSVGSLIAYLGLMSILHEPAELSIFSFSLVQLGVAGAERILSVMAEETELDENQQGWQAPLRGEIVFDHVSFSYGGAPVLKDVSFRAEPGQTVAIVGQTGSGKSTLTKLVNRTYDATSGRVLVDGVDVRDWSLESLRSQISTIEQDIFLFSRSIAENIGFSQGGDFDREAVITAARDAQADGFITDLKDGYDTVIGERGVTLSGGQRQRLAIARALLTDPRILILDDATSAIDSATEDEIQRAIRRLLQGRTTLLITHRLSQIRWADRVLVLQNGEMADFGTHTDLLERSPLYRRIFARYEGLEPARVTLGAASHDGQHDTAEKGA